MPTCADIFCGVGGLTAGFVDEGFVTVFGVDADQDSVASYQANFSGVALKADVVETDFTGIEADVVLGGLPCQGFSPLGRQNSQRDPRNGLWRHFVSALKQIDPQAFVAENVPGFLNSWAYPELRRHVHRLGFKTSAFVLNSVDFGVPQSRKRAFVMGVKGDVPVSSIPAPDIRRRTVRDGIGDLPAEISWEGMHRTTRSGKIVLERMRHVPVGGSRSDIPEKLLPPCWKKNKRSAQDVFGRLRWDQPSVTIRTSFIRPEKGRYLHPEANRAITLREGARLQAFPDDFVFKGSVTSIARQIGNAVPPPLASAVARAVKKILRDQKFSKDD